MREKGRSLF